MLRIAIVTGTRPGRLNEAVARWILDLAHSRPDVHTAHVDVAAYGLPSGSCASACAGQLASEHVRAWSRTVASFDGFVFVTPEYVLSSSTGLRTAIHLVAADWRDKAAGFVGYGAQGAMHTVEDLRQALAGAGVVTPTPHVSLTLVPERWRRCSFVPHPRHASELHVLLERVIAWASALKGVRTAYCDQRDDAGALCVSQAGFDREGSRPRRDERCPWP
jgi:NAD(P)H-dependent FMN reductase